ncbi:MAG: 2-oxo acid dehydrogenase subunit E2 [Chloroflexota bacterium]|nr:2-oxo acid dehydrogenase subunit E2 [Chloroflexota bacterium]
MSATTREERVWYSPTVRVLSAHLGIDPASISGTGRDGRVTRNDMLTASIVGAHGHALSPPSDDDVIPLSRIRRMTAENLTRTVREVPMERVYMTVDWTALIAIRAMMRVAFEAEYRVPLTYMPFILRGMVIAARTQPRVNSRWTAEGPTALPSLHLGVAVSTDGGLQAPIIHHAEDWSLVGLARALHRVITAARENRLTLADIQGGTITVTNPGPFGTVRSAPIIPPGQSAILSVDSVREIPVALDGALTIRSVATLGLTYDARLCDESDAVFFLTALQIWLEGGVYD